MKMNRFGLVILFVFSIIAFLILMFWPEYDTKKCYSTDNYSGYMVESKFKNGNGNFIIVSNEKKGILDTIKAGDETYNRINVGSTIK